MCKNKQEYFCKIQKYGKNSTGCDANLAYKR